MALCFSQLPPALLTDATWYGTLAAARDLGARGVPVTLACDRLIAPARFSRFVDRCVPCPSTARVEAFVEWLLDFSDHGPRHVLYPTSDEAAWHVSSRREELSKRFYLYSPPLESLVAVLDKAKLLDHARACGLDVPETWCPDDEHEVEELAQSVRFPLFLKPRLQVLSGVRTKGVRANEGASLLREWRAWQRAVDYHDDVRDRVPDSDRPLVQEYRSEGEQIYTVDGFIDESGELYVTRACTKLLQRPRRSGPGVVFDDAPVEAEIEEGLRRLCLRTGFYGVFDAEFLEQGERRMLIDFNPRFYNHMAFEIERGLPLPWLAYLAARGDRDALRRAVDSARAPRSDGRAYVHRFSTELLLGAQWLSGAMSPEERRRWRAWIADRAGRITDPARVTGDPLPALAEVAMETAQLVRHPRSFVRALAG